MPTGGDIEFKIGGDASPLVDEIKRAATIIQKRIDAINAKPVGSYFDSTNIKSQQQALDALSATVSKATASMKASSVTLRATSLAGVKGLQAQAQAAAALRTRLAETAKAAKAASQQVAKVHAPAHISSGSGSFVNGNQQDLVDYQNKQQASAAAIVAIKEKEQARLTAAAKVGAVEREALRRVSADAAKALAKSRARSLVSIKEKEQSQATASAKAGAVARSAVQKVSADAANKMATDRARSLVRAVGAEDRLHKSQLAAGRAAIVAAGGNGKYTRALTKTGKAVTRLAVTEAVASKSTKHFASANEFAAKEVAHLSRVVAIAQGPLGPVAGRLTAVATGLRQMGMGALVFGGAIAGMVAIMRRAIPAAIDLQRTYSVLEAATTNAAESFKVVIAESRRTGQGFAQLAGAYGQLAAAAKGTTLQGAGTVKIFKAINSAALALRLDIYQTKGALKAIEQMISKGTVSSEELRQQLGERLPGAFRMASDAMGMTTMAFSKVMAKGEILATDLLPRLSKVIEDRFAGAAVRASENLGVAMDKLTNETNLFFAALVNADQLNALTSSIDELTKSLQFLEDHIKTVSAAFTGLILGISTLGGAAVLGKMGKLILKTGSGLKSFASTIRAATTMTTSLRVATEVLTDAMLISPVGRVTKAVSWLTKAFSVLWPIIKKTAGWIAALGAGWWSYTNAQNAASVVTKGSIEDQRQLGEAIIAAQDKWSALEAQINKSLDLKRKALAKAGGDTRKVAAINRLFAASLRNTYKALDDQANVLGTLRSKYKGMTGSVRVLGEKSAATTKLLERLAAALNKHKTTADERLLRSAELGLKAEKAARDKLAADLLKEDDTQIKNRLKSQVLGSDQAIETLKGQIAQLGTLVAADTADAATKKKNKDARIARTEQVAGLKALAAKAAINDKLALLDVTKGSVEEAALKHSIARRKAKEAFDIAAVKAAKKSVLQTLVDKLAAERKLLDKGFAEQKKKLVAATKGKNAALLAESKIFGTEVGSIERLIAKQKLTRLRFTNRQELALVGAHGKALIELKKQKEAALKNFDSKQAEVRNAKKATDISSNAVKKTGLTASATHVKAIGASTQGVRADIAGLTGGELPSDRAARQLKQKTDAELAAYKASKDARQEAYNAEKAALDVQFKSTVDLTTQFDANEKEALAAHEEAKTQITLEAAQLRNQQILGLQGEFSALFQDGQQVNLDNMLTGIQSFGEESKGFAEADAKGKLAIAGKGFKALSGLMDSNNRKAFEVGKEAAVANATVDGIAAVMKASSSAPFPFNVPLMIAMGGIAAMNVQKIMSTKFKGGSSAKAVTSGGAASLSRATPTSVPLSNLSSSGNQNQPIQIYVNGVISQDQLVNQIVPEALKRQVANNDFVLIDQRSANGQLLQANGLV